MAPHRPDDDEHGPQRGAGEGEGEALVPGDELHGAGAAARERHARSEARQDHHA
jgi:hypothetical protein